MSNTDVDKFLMDKVWCEEVIICTIARRGKGIEGDPIRIVTQVFTKEGTLIAEHDEFLSQQKTKV